MTSSRKNSEPQFPFTLPQTPQEYLDILRFRWYWILAGIVLGAIGSQVSVRFVPQRFVSETVVLVEGARIPQKIIPRITTEQAADRLETIHEEILARPRIEYILDDLNPYPELMDAPRAQVVEMVRGRTGIGRRGKEAFVVQYTDTDPERAQQMAARLASLFIEHSSGDRAAQALDANRFIQDQLDETKRDLERVEARLGAVKTRNMGMLPGQLEANLATLQRLELRRQSIDSEIRAATERRGLLERQLTLQAQMDEPEAQLIPAVDPAASTNNEPATLGQLRQHLEELKTRYTDEHPEVQATQARIKKIESQQVTLPLPEAAPAAPPSVEVGALGGVPLPNVPGAAEPDSAPAAPRATAGGGLMAADMRAQLSAMSSEIKFLQERRNQVLQEMRVYQARVEQIPAVEQELVSLERDYDLMSKYYSELLSRKLEAETAGAIEKKWQQQFSIIDPAQVPDKADYPKPAVFLMLGTVVGLGAGIAGAFLLEVLDPSVKSVRELESLLPYPVLLTLPLVKHKRGERPISREPTPPSPPTAADEREGLSAAS